MSRTDEAARGAVATSATPEPAREENSGLHEIKALASTTRRRISQKVTSEAEAEESLLVGASSGSFRAAALPDPAREESTISRSSSGELVSDRAVASARERLAAARAVARPASELDGRSRASSAPFWLLGGVATAAAAAAVAVFVFGVGRENQKRDANQAASDQTAARAESPAPAGQAAAAGSPAPDGVRFAEPPPADPAPGAAPATTSAPAMVARGDDAQDAEAGAEEGGLKGRAGAGSSGDSKTEPKKDGKEKDKEESQKKKPPLGKGSGGKDLGDVLDEVTGGVQAPTPLPEEGPRKPSKKSLDRRDVSSAMGAVRSQAMRCRDKENYEGTVTVKFHVAPSGAVTSAAATGSKAGTPTGDCVAAAVKKARFPAFDGAPTSFTYPFLLAE